MNTVNFSLDPEELRPIIELLQDTLLNRPELDEYDPYDDVDEAIDSASPFFDAFQNLIALPVTGLDTQVLMDTVMGIRDGYQTFWQRPFPDGLEAGQPLFSAVMERPMREMLRFLTQLSRSANNGDAGDSTLQLFLDAEEEMACFQAWREEQEEKQTRHYSSSVSKGTGLGSLALAFGLGWLLGNDDD
ncbi:MAG: hypothetical protein Q4B17_12290 [Lautropia sp.]|nr:hypothetical protein [Lautropia sp.]